MLEGLRAALDTTGYDFVLAAWRSPPEGADYGCYMLDGQNALTTGEGAASEIMLTGTVDYFTKDHSMTPKETIEAALNSLDCFWALESVQFEEESGYIHYEWSFVDTNGNISSARDQ